MTRDIGFDRSNILSTVTTAKIADSREAVRQKLLQNTDITDVTFAASDFIRASNMNWGRPDLANENKVIRFDVYPVMWNFLSFMGIEVTEGRDFIENDHLSADGVIIFNETAKNQLGISLESSIIGHHEEPCTLAGFCKDFNSKPLQYGISPYAFYIFGKDPWGHWPLRQLYVRTAKGVDIQKATDYIRATLIEIDPDYEIVNPEIVSFEKEVERNYANEKRIQAMVTIFTIIAIIISVMGIFGIVLFDTERRRKEIGVRKVNGATELEILTMFNRKFLILTAICSAVAIPLAYFIISTYFSGFAYHYDVNVWPFILGVLAAMMATALVVTGASLRAANENPVETLKSE
jgi:putative ABC transport system permease protein